MVLKQGGRWLPGDEFQVKRRIFFVEEDLGRIFFLEEDLGMIFFLEEDLGRIFFLEEELGRIFISIGGIEDIRENAF